VRWREQGVNPVLTPHLITIRPLTDLARSPT
jgi:hypothetical protein